LHTSAFLDAQEFVKKYLQKKTMIIADIGSYNVNGCLKPIFTFPEWHYIGYDRIAGPNVDVVISNDYDWPEIKTNSCDVVVSTQVLEHVKHPWRWIKEIARICKPGGLIYICSPNTIAFHEHPIDCWRVWPDGMRGIFDEANLDVVDVYATPINGFIGDTTGIARKKFNHLLI